MSRPDYEKKILHHSYLLVLLRGVGPSKPRSLQKAFEKVRKVNNVKVTDSSGVVRDIWIRYIHDHPVENNDWGDFQTHRRLLGLVTIGKFDTQPELNELCRQHESLKVRYGTTLYDSRAIFFGPAEAQQTDDVMLLTDNNSIENHVNTIDKNSSDALGAILEKSSRETDISTLPTKRLEDEFTTPSNFKAQAFFYRENDACADLEAHINDFVNALFWILESRRLERSREKVEKFTLLMAPIEKRDFVGLDMESRNNKKRIVGRVTKNLADLSLQAGLIEHALSLYHSACETLRSVMDSLWEGAAEEGLCAASALLLYPHMRADEILYRNASLQEGGGCSPLKKNTPEKWRQSDLTKTVNATAAATAQTSNEQNSKLQQLTQHNHENSSSGMTQHHSPPPHSASTSSVSSMLSNSTMSHSSSTTSSTTTLSAATPQDQPELPGNILKPDEIPIYFRRAIINYSKYRRAAIVEIEAAFKAARISIEQNRPLDVAIFLQNILYVNHSMTEPERIKSFEVMTELYLQIGYRRKAAFFQRLAALKHVHHQPSNGAPDWTKTYKLMLSSFPGYLLSLDPLEVLENNSGWPSLQIELLQSLITAARRLGHSTLATRHMTFLLQTQWHNMSAAEQSDMAMQLQNLSAQCEGSPVPLVLDSGTVIPPANLTDLPYCLDLLVKDLPPHLRPQRIKIAKADCGPFLFTPITQFNSMDRRDKQKNKNKIAFSWIQNNLSEVSIRLRNPLPFELPVNDMRLLTNGIVFKSVPQSVVLQPNVPTYVTLHGTPIEVGQLEVQGYSTHNLGVKSNCRLKHMKNRQFPPNFLIEVLPALPTVQLKTSLPQTATFSNMTKSDIVITSASLTLYNGESATCVVTVTNDSDIPIEYLDVTMTSNVEQEMLKKIFRMSEEEIKSKLPIAPESSIELTVSIYGEADFICPMDNQRAVSIHSSSTMDSHAHHTQQHYSTQLSSSSAGAHGSLPSRVASPSQYSSTSTRRTADTAYSSFRSTTSAAQQSVAGLSLTNYSAGAAAQPTNIQTHNIEAQFRFKYSGGEAMEQGYCRQCAISFNLELLPSAQVTSWDVLPAEIPSQFYLVLDISNLTAQEMSLNYTNNKNILIEAKESCRVPIPVDRCSLEDVWAAREAEIAENLEKELCFRTQMGSFNDSVSRLCSKHIAERVKINWLLTGTDIKGIASLKGILLTTTMIDLCTVSPLQWNISFKDQPVQPQAEVVCTAGQTSLLVIAVTNQSLQPLKNLILTIKFYQDYLNGMENYSLETRVAVSGPNRIRIPILHKDEQFHHECSVMFFTPGRFKTSIQCHAKPASSSSSSSLSLKTNAAGAVGTATASSLSQSCPVPQSSTQDASSMLQITVNDITLAQSYHEQQQQEHIWKFIPPIEVTVVEQQ